MIRVCHMWKVSPDRTHLHPLRRTVALRFHRNTRFEQKCHVISRVCDFYKFNILLKHISAHSNNWYWWYYFIETVSLWRRFKRTLPTIAVLWVSWVNFLTFNSNFSSDQVTIWRLKRPLCCICSPFKHNGILQNAYLWSWDKTMGINYHVSDRFSTVNLEKLFL